MNYDLALEKFGEAYRDRKKEFALIFKLCDFRKKFVLEIGSGSEGHFLKECLKKTDNVMATDISEQKLKELVKKFNIQTKVCSAETLQFYNRSFDIVFSRWVIQHTDVKKAVNEMCRASDRYIVIVLPNEEGDETRLKTIVEKNNYEKRKKRISDIKKYIIESKFRVKESRILLRFRFPNIKIAMDILSAVEFDNKVSDSDKEKIEKFLKQKQKRKTIEFTQGASFILGTRR